MSDSHGRVLVTQRPTGKHLAGLWEFPGGKCEPDEAPQVALRRELSEEIGIQTGTVEPLISVPWTYPEKSIFLDVYRVLDYCGEAHGREAQALQWVSPDELAGLGMPLADRPVVTALRLPRHYVISPEPGADPMDFLRRLALVIESGARLVQLRSKHLPERDLRVLVARAQERATPAGAQVLINHHVALARDLDLAGIHLPAAELLRCQSRPLPMHRWVGASCHDARELAHAAAIGVDFVTLGPVLPTTTHPGATTLGWRRFAELVAATPLPVYALGGLARSDLARAVAAGAQGVAGISAFWPKN